MISQHINISGQELKLLSDPTFFQFKKNISDKISLLFTMLEENIHLVMKENSSMLPAECISNQGKISRGENYLGLPWMVLDYPRVFSNDDAFAFRALMWWGNFFSFTLHVSGRHLRQADLSQKSFKKLSGENIFFCIHSYQWHHHFERDNYRGVELLLKEKFSFEDHVKNAGFLKVSKKIKLAAWNKVPTTGTAAFKIMMNALIK